MDENRLQLLLLLHSLRAELDDLVIAAEADCVTLDGAAHAVRAMYQRCILSLSQGNFVLPC